MPKSLSAFWKKCASLFKGRGSRGSKLAFQKRVHAERRFPLRLEARFFVMLALWLAFYFIAANIGSGWIYLISAGLLSSLVLGFFLPAIPLASVTALFTASKQLTAGQPAAVRIKIRRKRACPGWMPLSWLQVRHELPAGTSRGEPDTRPFLIESLDGEKAFVWITGPMVRGVHALGSAVVSTCFPLGISWWTRRLPADKEQTITVYPKIVPIDGFFFYRLRSTTVSRGGLSRTSSAARQSTSTRGVRDYVRGDSPRHVHWASSARTGRLLVREFEAEGFPVFDVMLDLSAPWTSDSQFELAVTAAASLLSLGHRLGIGPELVLNLDGAEGDIELPPTAPGIETQMETLARVKRVVPKSVTLINSYRSLGMERALVVVRPARLGPVSGPNCYFVEVEDAQPHQADGASSRAHEEGAPGLLSSVLREEKDLFAL